MNDIDIGYLAATIDSEGSILLVYANKKANHPKPVISITSTSKKLIDHLVEITKSGKIYNSLYANKQNPKHKPAWILFWTSHRDVMYICSLIKDRVIIKRTQVNMMIEYIKYHNDYINSNNKPIIRESVFQKERELYNSLKLTNQKGLQSVGKTIEA